MFNSIQVHYKSTRNAYIANQYLQEISKYPIIAWDFEVAVRYTPEEIAEWTTYLEENPNLSKLERMEILSQINATALGHPYHCTITHCSIAISEDTSYVFILDNKSITTRVLTYLLNSPQKQVLHNASYDFRQLMYHTGRIPSDFEDTQILAKTLLNHVETFKARVGLKDLAGRWYGAWAISKDDFSLARMYDEHVLHYAAIDACATYKLWMYLNHQCDILDGITTPEENDGL